MRKLIGTFLTTTVIAAVLMVSASSAHADPTPTPTPAPAPAAGATQLNCGPDWLQNLCNTAVAAAPLAGQAVGAAVPPIGGAVAVADNAAQVVDFVKDPLGFLSAAVMGAATWMLSQVAALANASTAPDLTAQWWIDAYQKGMAVGIVLFCFVLLYETFMLVRRRITPDQFMATMSLYAPATLAAMLFGPAVFQFLIQGATYLADGIIRSLTGFGGSDSFNAIDKSIQNTSVWATGATGAVQAFLALFFGLLMLIAAVLVYLSLCMQAIVIYLGTALFAVGVVWYASTRHREHAWSIPRLVVTIVFSKCVLFFTLGVCLAIATAATALQGNGISGDLALIVMAIIGMFLAAFTPLILLKHAPILPGMGAGVGVGLGIVGSAAGFAAGRAAVGGAGRAARAGGSKLAAVSSRKGAPTPPPGAPSSGAHRIDGPAASQPPAQSGPSKASKAGAAAAAGAAGSRGAGRVVDPPIPGSTSSASRDGSGSAARSAAATSLRPAGQSNGAGDSKRSPRGRQPSAAAAKPTVRADRAAGRQPGQSAPKPGAAGGTQSNTGQPRQDSPPTGRASSSAAPNPAPSKLNQATRKPSTPPPTGGTS